MTFLFSYDNDFIMMLFIFCVTSGPFEINTYLLPLLNKVIFNIVVFVVVVVVFVVVVVVVVVVVITTMPPI